jgi:hypothetical protein
MQQGSVHYELHQEVHNNKVSLAVTYRCFVDRASWYINLYEPCVLYIGQAHRYPPKTPFYIFFQQISLLNFLNMLHSPSFFLFKMPFIS